MQKKVADVRRENFRRLIAQRGGPAAMSKALGYSTTSLVSQVNTGKKTIGEKLARAIEGKLQIPSGSLDIEPGKTAIAPFEGTSHPLMADSMRELADALEAVKLEIPSAKFARLVAEIYERAAMTGRVDADHVRRLVALLK